MNSTNVDDFTIKSLDVTQDEIESFCQHWNITKLEIFGSATTGALTDSSDIDLLVEYSPSFERTMADQIRIQNEIEALFGREVDLITKNSITKNPNPIFLDSVMRSLVTIYEG